MKNKIILVLTILILLPFGSLFADVISSPAATVNLIRNRIITNTELNEKQRQYQAEAIEAGSSEIITRSDVLDVLINDELVLQGAERDGYTIKDSQLDQLLRQQRSYVEEQIGQKITDLQFEQVIKNSYGIGLEEFRKSLKESAIVDLYVRGKMASALEEYNNPTDKEINDFFRTNRSAFMNPELVRISHIFIPFDDDSDKAEAKKQMDQLARWIKYGTYTFEELVPRYSKDKDSKDKGGDIGWLAYDDSDMRSYLGPQFFDEVFTLSLGKPSGVLESNGGYHIVKVTTHTEAKLLGLNDYINPDSRMTVYQYIEQTLISRSKQVAYLRAIEKLVTQLRNEAEVKILISEEL
ncbi:MAG: peptidylprolyl isomerase [Sphaerochaetaceae bacterium]